MTRARLTFDRGTLLLEHVAADAVPPGFVFDPRVRLWRAPAGAYHDTVWWFRRAGLPLTDDARGYETLGRTHRSRSGPEAREPRAYQTAAVDAWRAAGRRGVVVLPTGAGKSFVAELCIADADRSALVVAPTLDLVAQWHGVLTRAFGEPVGVLGGGVRDVQAITVSTYDSAHLQAEKLGQLFGLLVFDEVHHLPGDRFALAADQSIAPFRLGLTATLERTDGGHERLRDLVGPVVYTLGIRDLAGDWLAPYRTEVVKVRLCDADRAAYDMAVEEVREFRRSHGIQGGRGGFRQFLREAARSIEGRSALAAFRASRRLVQRAPEKLEMVGALLARHKGSRCLVFTHDNATAYEVSRTFLVPAVTHRTPLDERKEWLAAFASGELPVLAASRVLNEGVDLPAAEVAIVVSGSGTTREHVQRLGRILRPGEGKQAVLYELVVAATVEESTSARRRNHDAYRNA